MKRAHRPEVKNVHVENKDIHLSNMDGSRDYHAKWNKPEREGRLLESESVSCLVVSDSLQLHEHYSLPGTKVPGILQARILEWIAIPFCKGSFWLRNQTWDCCIAGRFFTFWATREAPKANVWYHLYVEYKKKEWYKWT